MDTGQTAGDHYTSLQGFYERLTRHLAIRIPLWLPGTSTLEEAMMHAHTYMAQAAKPAKGQYILDAGCGLGSTAFWLAREFEARVLGVSNSASNIDRCLALAKERDLRHLTDFRVADLMTSEFPEETFDSVWNLESLNYLCPKQHYVQKAFGMLRPGGTWVCMDRYSDVRGCDDGRNQAAEAVLTTGLYTPQHWVDAGGLQAYMRQAGFIDVSYLDLTEYAVASRAQRRRGGSGAAPALLTSVWRPSSFRALLRARRVIRASFDLMERGLMTYGLLSGSKPPKPASLQS
jgi:cyclopropane fatty-acyl-phospholipid synthase-like methyltransferase